jgi:uncharacterized protein (DUF433 family)
VQDAAYDGAKLGYPTDGVWLMDWSKCPDVERTPDKVSGAWVVKGTRVPVQAVVDNAEDGYTPEQITGEIFEGLTLDRVRSVIRFAKVHGPGPA